jgi:DNA-binding CsgD family transcriptional regulator
VSAAAELTKVDRLRIGAIVAPAVRRGSARKVVVVGKDGKPVREATLAEIQAGVARRAEIEFGTNDETRPKEVVCNSCRAVFKPHHNGPIPKHCPKGCRCTCGARMHRHTVYFAMRRGDAKPVCKTCHLASVRNAPLCPCGQPATRSSKEKSTNRGDAPMCAPCGRKRRIDAVRAANTGKQRISADAASDIARHHASGLHTNAISAAVGVSYLTVARFLKARGMTPNPNPSRVGTRPRRTLTIRQARALEAIRSGKACSLESFAVELGCDTKTATNTLSSLTRAGRVAFRKIHARAIDWSTMRVVDGITSASPRAPRRPSKGTRPSNRT